MTESSGRMVASFGPSKWQNEALDCVSWSSLAVECPLSQRGIVLVARRLVPLSLHTVRPCQSLRGWGSVSLYFKRYFSITV